MLAWRRRATGALVVLMVALPRGAVADGPSKDACLDSYERAQRLRKDYKLRAAHEQLVTCGADSCPAVIRQDCARWLGEVEASTPTIVVLARGTDGGAIERARATLDGEPLADALDGRAVAVDPGPHDLRCEADGAAVQTRIVVAEGAKNQQFVVTFGAALAPAPVPVARPPSRSTRGIPTATWVLGGVAVAGAISFTAFAVAGREVQSCAPTCTRSQVDELRRDYLVADISWITGLVAAGAAVYFALAAPSSTPPATAIRW